jgi:hypothetical protein
MNVAAKTQVHRILDDLPDDATLEEIEYRIHLHRKVERGLADLREGNVVDQEEASGGWSGGSAGKVDAAGGRRPRPDRPVSRRTRPGLRPASSGGSGPHRARSPAFLNGAAWFPSCGRASFASCSLAPIG